MTAEAAAAAAIRFPFGRNWRRFLEVVDEGRVESAACSLEEMLGRGAVEGQSFLDVGAGSGLFSLAALRLGAARVHSFDFDDDAVACARALKDRFAPDAERGTIERGDILLADYISALGCWDVVYAWGVLHHTGRMWSAIDNAARLVEDGGALFLALYNDQGWKSRFWHEVKRTYNRLPPPLRPAFAAAVMGPREFGFLSLCVLTGRPRRFVDAWLHYRSRRGMSRLYDLIDWVGGYPFEVARPEEVLDFLRPRGFALERLITVGGRLGCNEFVFRRRDSATWASGVTEA